MIEDKSEVILSILMPVYNCVNTIERAIRSYLKYEMPNTELVIVDGASTDGTVDIINKYSEKISKFISEKDNGVSFAVNKAIDLAEGEWILILAADDILINNPEKILKKFNNKELDIICGNTLVDNKDSTYYKWITGDNLNNIEYNLTVSTPATFFRKSIVEEVGKYDTSYKIAADRDLWIKLKRYGARYYSIDYFIELFSVGGLSSSSNTINILNEENNIIDKKYCNRKRLQILKSKKKIKDKIKKMIPTKIYQIYKKHDKKRLQYKDILIYIDEVK